MKRGSTRSRSSRSCGSRRRGEDGRCMPQVRGQRGDVLQMEGQARRYEGVGRPPAEGARGGERQAEEAVGRGDARQRHAAGHGRKKMVRPAARREAASHLGQVYEVSHRRACRGRRPDRRSISYRSRRPEDGLIRSRLRAIAALQRRFGYHRQHTLLRREGITLNHKKLRRQRALGPRRCGMIS
jgi:putative transposase